MFGLILLFWFSILCKCFGLIYFGLLGCICFCALLDCGGCVFARLGGLDVARLGGCACLLGLYTFWTGCVLAV